MGRPVQRGLGRRALGLDGTPAGWYAVALVDGGVREGFVAASVAQALERVAPAVVAVDMPVGLVDAGREADEAARWLLSGAASTVFATPPRAVVEGWRRGEVRTHAQATELAVAVTGKGMSQQAWRLVPKIAEVDALRPTLGDALLEVHPELAFRQLAGGRVPPRKRSWAGMEDRRALLTAAGVELGAGLDDTDRVAVDDVLDAAVCAWVAAAAASGAPLQAHPAEPAQTDGRRPIVMWTRPRPPAWPPPGSQPVGAGERAATATLGGDPELVGVMAMDLAEGLRADKRFRCAACGNLTRFDLEVVEHSRRFWHAALSGEGEVEEEQLLNREIKSITCRWCGTSEGIEVVDAPGATEIAAER